MLGITTEKIVDALINASCVLMLSGLLGCLLAANYAIGNAGAALSIVVGGLVGAIPILAIGKGV